MVVEAAAEHRHYEAQQTDALKQQVLVNHFSQVLAPSTPDHQSPSSPVEPIAGDRLQRGAVAADTAPGEVGLRAGALHLLPGDDRRADGAHGDSRAPQSGSHLSTFLPPDPAFSAISVAIKLYSIVYLRWCARLGA